MAAWEFRKANFASYNYEPNYMDHISQLILGVLVEFPLTMMYMGGCILKIKHLFHRFGHLKSLVKLPMKFQC